MFYVSLVNEVFSFFEESAQGKDDKRVKWQLAKIVERFALM